MGQKTPIGRGAMFRDVSCTDTHTHLIRVVDVWVDEDHNTQLQVVDENTDDSTGESVDIDSFIECVESSEDDSSFSFAVRRFRLRRDDEYRGVFCQKHRTPSTKEANESIGTRSVSTPTTKRGSGDDRIK